MEIEKMEDWIELSERIKMVPDFYVKAFDAIFPDGVYLPSRDRAARDIINYSMALLDALNAPLTGEDLAKIAGKYPTAELEFSKKYSFRERVALLTASQLSELAELIEKHEPNPSDVYSPLALMLEVAAMFDHWRVPLHEFPPLPDPADKIDWMDQEYVTNRPVEATIGAEARRRASRGISLRQRLDCLNDIEKLVVEEDVKKLDTIGDDQQEHYRLCRSIGIDLDAMGVPSTVIDLRRRSNIKKRYDAALVKHGAQTYLDR